MGSFQAAAMRNTKHQAFQSIPSPLAYGKLQRGWQHLFRRAILKMNWPSRSCTT
jgi:hypothetical protein